MSPFLSLYTKVDDCQHIEIVFYFVYCFFMSEPVCPNCGNNYYDLKNACELVCKHQKKLRFPKDKPIHLEYIGGKWVIVPF